MIIGSVDKEVSDNLEASSHRQAMLTSSHRWEALAETLLQIDERG